MAETEREKPQPQKDLKTQDMPPAGPHARDDLIDNEKTPGTGSLPDDGGGEADVGSE